MDTDGLQLLGDLLAIDSPGGDEAVMADWLTEWCRVSVPSAAVTRLRDCLIVAKGPDPKVAIFAHIDTNGWTVGYDDHLIPIGSPDVKKADTARRIGDSSSNVGSLVKRSSETWHSTGLVALPGERLVFAATPVLDEGNIRAPYLDNRAGVWAAMQALLRCDSVVVAFTTGEEMNTSGAMICARYVYDKLDVTKALISDITWDTEHVHCGSGVAISRRDRSVPSQRYVDRVVELASESGISFQIEIESEGGSDGMGIERIGCPIDWVFVGAPEQRPHSAAESLALSDLDAMADLLTYLAVRL